MNEIIAESNLDFTEICRTCLQKGEMKNLFDVEVTADKLTYFTNLKITQEDCLPNQICMNCLNQVNLAFHFAKKCQATDVFLRKYYNDTKYKLELNSIHNDHTYDKKPAETTDKIKKTKSIPPYVCKKCNEHFQLYHLLKEHFKTHTKKDYCGRPCPICSKIISYSHMTHHIRTHTLEKPYCCEFCGKRFVISGNLARHRRVHSGEKPYVCDICGKRFTQSTRMKDHRRSHTGEKPFVCNFCGKSFGHNGYFRYHIKKHEKQARESKLTEGKLESDPTKIADAPSLKLNCEICSQIFASTRAYKTHLLSHEEKKYNCTDCGRGFTDINRLKNHLKTHTSNRPFVCHICQKAFTNKTNLKNHIFVHSGERPFSCKFCERSFAQIGQLKYHLRVHTGEKPYVCNICGKPFTLNGNLTVHMRIHTGETPYRCSICNKGFYDSSSMKKHEKIHSNDKKSNKTSKSIETLI